MLTLARFVSVTSLINATLTVLLSTVHRLQMSDLDAYRHSPLVVVTGLLVLALMLGLLPQLIATGVLIWKRKQSKAWAAAALFALIALPLATIAAMNIDPATLLYAT